MIELTNREKEVMELVASGFSNNEIAKKLFISKTTVTTHLAVAYFKLGVNEQNRTTGAGVVRVRAVLKWQGIQKQEAENNAN